MARLRQPSRVRRLNGNPSNTPIPNEPEIPKWEPGKTPAFLPEAGKLLYEQFVPRLRKYLYASAVDEPMLVAMCASWGLSMDALSYIRNKGIIRNGKNKSITKVVKHPAHTIWRDNMQLFMQFAKAFGMTPTDRAKLFAGEKPEEPQTRAKKKERGDTLDGNWAPPSKAA